MQDTGRYHEFADVLARAADGSSPATRHLLLSAAEAWREMAGPEEQAAIAAPSTVSGNVTFVDFKRRA